MSRLEELIQQLCPDGVEYKELGEVATVSRGGNFQKRIMSKMDFHVSTMVRYIRGITCFYMMLLRI